MQNPPNSTASPVPAPSSTPGPAPQPLNTKPNNPQSQPVRPTSSASQAAPIRPPSQNQSGQQGSQSSQQGSSTSGLMDRMGDKPRSGTVPTMAGQNLNGQMQMGGTGQGSNQTSLGGGSGLPRVGSGGVGPALGSGNGGMGHPNRPTNITIPTAFPVAPNSSGTTPYQPPNSALNTPAASTANTPTGTSTFGNGGPTSSHAGPSTYSRSNTLSSHPISSSAATRMIGQNDRSVIGQGRLFSEPLAKEHARTQTERAGLRSTYDVKGMVMADRAVEGMIASLMRSAGRIKDHRVGYTNPRPAPFWPSDKDEAGKREKVKKDGMDVDEADEEKEVPMWKVDVLDDPRKDILAAHAAIEESERAKKSTRVIERSEWDRKKQAEAEGRSLDEPKVGEDGMQVDGIGPLAGSASVGNASAGPSTPGPSTPGLVAPDHMAETPMVKKKTGKKNPQQEQDLAAKRAAEAQKKETARALASVLGPSKKYSWMSGGTGAGSPKTPLGSRLGVGGLGSGGKHKRASMQDGKIKIESGGISSPSTPGPAGMRGNKRPLEGTPLNAAKRAKKGSGLMNDSTTAMLMPAPSKPNPYEFVKVEDKLEASDLSAALRREVIRGGPNRAIYERKYLELMVQMAEAAHEEWKKENAGLGGSTIAGGNSLD